MWMRKCTFKVFTEQQEYLVCYFELLNCCNYLKWHREVLLLLHRFNRLPCLRHVNKHLFKQPWCSALTWAASSYALCRTTEHRGHGAPRSKDLTSNTRLGAMSSAKSCHTAGRQRAGVQQHPQSSTRVSALFCAGHGMGTEKGIVSPWHPRPLTTPAPRIPAERWIVPKCHRNSSVPRVFQKDTVPKLDQFKPVLHFSTQLQSCCEEPESLRLLSVIEDPWMFGCKILKGIAIASM